jgi:hypothetical protein
VVWACTEKAVMQRPNISARNAGWTIFMGNSLQVVGLPAQASP